jgi:putative phage-type endonuclease
MDINTRIHPDGRTCIITHATKEDWLNTRKLHLTATDMAQVLGLSKFGGPCAVALSKTGEGQPIEETERMEWGRRLEEAILAGFSARRNVNISLCDPMAVYKRVGIQRFCASLDGLIETGDGTPGEPVDAKNIRFLDQGEWGEDGSDRIPDHYAIQVQMQMLVTGANRGHLAALFSGQELRCYTLERNQKVIDDIMAAGEAWWDRHIVRGVPPPPDGSEAMDKHLAKRFQRHDDQMVTASPDGIAAAMKLRDLSAEIDRLTAEAEVQKQVLKEFIGEHLGMTGPGFRITWKQSAASESTDWRGVALDLCDDPDLLKKTIVQNTSTKPGSRRFLPKFTTKE